MLNKTLEKNILFCILWKFFDFKDKFSIKNKIKISSSSSLWSQKSVRGLQVNISSIKPFLILNSFRENVSSALGKIYEKIWSVFVFFTP
jgi:hypothetical protein